MLGELTNEWQSEQEKEYHKCSKREVKPDAARRKRKSSLLYWHIRVSLLPGSQESPHCPFRVPDCLEGGRTLHSQTSPKRFSVAAAAEPGVHRDTDNPDPREWEQCPQGRRVRAWVGLEASLSCWLRLQSFPLEDWVVMATSRSWKHIVAHCRYSVDFWWLNKWL